MDLPIFNKQIELKQVEIGDFEPETSGEIINDNNIINSDLSVDKHSDKLTSSKSEFLFNKTRQSIKEQLNRTIEADIKDTICWRFLYRKSGNIFEVLSLLTSLVSTVLAFSAGAFDHNELSFAAGCLGSISMAFMKAHSYAMNESRERNEQLNQLLEKAHIKYMPSLIQPEE